MRTRQYCEAQYEICRVMPLASSWCKSVTRDDCCPDFNDLYYCGFLYSDWFMYLCIGVGIIFLILCIVIIACCCFCKKGGRGGRGGGKDQKEQKDQGDGKSGEESETREEEV